MNGRVTDPRPSSALREHELLARLGLGPGASNDEVEAAHDDILEYLAKAPGSLRGWARVHVTEVDEAYARLNGAPASASDDVSFDDASITSTPAASSGRGGRSQTAPKTLPGGLDDDLEGYLDDPDQPVVITRRERRAAQAQAARAQAVRSQPKVAGAIVIRSGTLKRVGAGGLALVVIVAVALGVYGFNPGSVPGINGTPAPAASGGLDTAAVAADMQKIAANPNDKTALMDLANLYYSSGDFATAETWLQKVLAIDPKNTDALLALGASDFNTGDNTSAQKQWEKVLSIDPKNVEAYYDLGFMYFSENPPNIAKVKEEWGQVVALAPNSDIANTVKTHLDSLGSPAPGASGGAVGSPAAGSPAPAGSPASAPSALPSPAAS